MIADLFEVRETDDRGFGLFARVFIPKGTLIDYQCDLCERICGRADLENMSHEKRQQIMEHTYTTDECDVILDCSIGRYMNHSCSANVLENGGEFDIAVRDVQAGEEVTCDYRQFNDPDEGFPCYCGEPMCCGTVAPVRPIPPDLAAAWDDKTRAACEEIRLPHQFSTGIGSERVALPTWRPPREGELWEPQHLSPTASVVRRISNLLNRRSRSLSEGGREQGALIVRGGVEEAGDAAALSAYHSDKGAAGP